MRILAIDMGSSTIKAVELDSAFGRFNIHDYHESPINEERTQLIAMTELLENLPKSPDKIILAMPSGSSTFRNLHLPTRDKKAIQSGIGFELEDEIPFSADESIFEYATISQNKQGTTLHVAATIKKHISAALTAWQFLKIDPDFVTTETWAYRTLMNHILGPPDKQVSPIILVNIGHSRTMFYVHWKGTPLLVRELNWGGYDLTKALAQQMNLDEVAAESLKLDQGIVALQTDAHAEGKAQDEGDTQLTPEQKQVSECLEKALQILEPELRQLEIACRKFTNETASTVYLAGGTSLLPGLNRWIEKFLRIPTKPLLALSAINTSGVAYSEQTDAKFAICAGLGLSIVGAERAHCINFRKKEFAKNGRTREINFKLFRKPLIAVAIVVTCLILSLVVQSYVYESRLATTQVQLEKSVKSFFGQLSNSAIRTYLSNTTTLQSSIKKELDKQRELSRLLGANANSPLDFLKNISQAIPPDVVVDLMEFKSGFPESESFTTKSKPWASLTFYVTNPQTIEKLKPILNGKLSDLHSGNIEEVHANVGAPDGTTTGVKKWKVNFSGRPGDGSK